MRTIVLKNKQLLIKNCLFAYLQLLIVLPDCILRSFILKITEFLNMKIKTVNFPISIQKIFFAKSLGSLPKRRKDSIIIAKKYQNSAHAQKPLFFQIYSVLKLKTTLEFVLYTVIAKVARLKTFLKNSSLRVFGVA